MSDPVGNIAALWRFPVKSMRGGQLEEVELTDQGIVGDRAYALIEAETGKVVSAKSVKRWSSRSSDRRSSPRPACRRPLPWERSSTCFRSPC